MKLVSTYKGRAGQHVAWALFTTDRQATTTRVPHAASVIGALRIGSTSLLRGQIVILSSGTGAPGTQRQPAAWSRHNSVSMAWTFTREIASRGRRAWSAISRVEVQVIETELCTEPFSVGRVSISGTVVMLGYPQTKNRRSTWPPKPRMCMAVGIEAVCSSMQTARRRHERCHCTPVVDMRGVTARPSST